METTIYNGPARFIGYRGRECKTDRIREVVIQLSDGTLHTEYFCEQCDYRAAKSASVRGHLSLHPLPGKPRSGRPVGSRKRSRHSDEVNEAIEREIARRVERELQRGASKRSLEREVARQRLAEVRRENRELRKRLKNIRAAIVGNV